MIEKLKSIESSISKVVQYLDIQDSYNQDDFIEFISDALRLIGSYYQLTKREAILNVENYKCKLPCDFYILEDIIDHYEVTDVEDYRFIFNSWFATAHSYTELFNFYTNLYRDTSLGNYKKYNSDNKGFKIEHNYLYSGFEKGCMRISYMGLALDESTGYPLVPDDPSYDLAFTYYIAKILIIQGKLTTIDMNFANNEWKRYCSQARGKANTPDVAMQRNLGFEYTKQPTYYYGKRKYN